MMCYMYAKHVMNLNSKLNLKTKHRLNPKAKYRLNLN